MHFDIVLLFFDGVNSYGRIFLHFVQKYDMIDPNDFHGWERYT